MLPRAFTSPLLLQGAVRVEPGLEHRRRRISDVRTASRAVDLPA